QRDRTLEHRKGDGEAELSSVVHARRAQLEPIGHHLDGMKVECNRLPRTFAPEQSQFRFGSIELLAPFRRQAVEEGNNRFWAGSRVAQEIAILDAQYGKKNQDDSNKDQRDDIHGWSARGAKSAGMIDCPLVAG